MRVVCVGLCVCVCVRERERDIEREGERISERATKESERVGKSRVSEMEGERVVDSVWHILIKMTMN